MQTSQLVDGKAGSRVPTAKGSFAGAEVFSYVWPTSLDSSAVGFEEKSGILALALGPWQFSNRLRQRALRVHRWIGRGYVLAVLFGGVGGVALARHSLYGMVTHIGFGLLGVSWLFTTLAAYVSIRARNRVAHRRWMIRSFALTLAAVTLRIYLPLSAVAGIPFPDAYQAISWLCWVINLIVVEIWLRRGSVTRAPAEGLASA